MIEIITIVIYYCIHSFFNNIVQETGHIFYNKNNIDSIHDFFHDILPDISHNEYIINILGCITLIPIILTDLDIKTRFLSMIIVVYLIRDITINLTILPKHNKCKKPNNKFLMHIVGGCYDKIFSGHFSIVYLLTLFYYSYGIITSIPLLISWNILNALMLLSTRAHYSIDIVMAFFVCSFVFTNNIELPLTKII
jgi:hypothetical protein